MDTLRAMDAALPVLSSLAMVASAVNVADEAVSPSAGAGPLAAMAPVMLACTCLHHTPRGHNAVVLATGNLSPGPQNGGMHLCIPARAFGYVVLCGACSCKFVVSFGCSSAPHCVYYTIAHGTADCTRMNRLCNNECMVWQSAHPGTVGNCMDVTRADKVVVASKTPTFIPPPSMTPRVSAHARHANYSAKSDPQVFDRTAEVQHWFLRS